MGRSCKATEQVHVISASDGLCYDVSNSVSPTPHSDSSLSISQMSEVKN